MAAKLRTHEYRLELVRKFAGDDRLVLPVEPQTRKLAGRSPARKGTADQDVWIHDGPRRHLLAGAFGALSTVGPLFLCGKLHRLVCVEVGLAAHAIEQSPEVVAAAATEGGEVAGHGFVHDLTLGRPLFASDSAHGPQ